MGFSDLSDEKLMREAAQGRFSAFEEYFERHQGRLMNFYWRLTGSEEAARALFESSWPELYKIRGTQSAAQASSVMLFAVAVRKGMRMLAENPNLSVPRGSAAGGDKSSLSWRSARLNDALLSLPMRERITLLLCFFDSLTYSQAALCLNEREENIRSLAGQGLGRLRETLGEGFLSGGLA
jgi:DNA-directed RNA polymerase specialized sigma24 family protein